MEKVSEDANLEFKWLTKRGVGGKNRKVQFYESFIYDGVKYSLYDCVYMYKEGIEEPFIGMLTKIWECPDKSKKVKVHWFFRPEEISTWLGETKTLENEILFASGEGVGLANMNPLEAIAGPCNVVCISKDNRNPQPSDDELKAADFIFYRTFDVQSCTILDKMDNAVGGIDIKYVFNRKDGESISPSPDGTSDRKEENPNTTIPNDQNQSLTVTISNKLKGAAKDESQDKDNPSVLKRNMTLTEYDKLQDRPLKKLKPDDKKLPEEKHAELKVAQESERLVDMPSKKSKLVNSIKLPVDGKSKLEDKSSPTVNNLKSARTSGTNSEIGKTDMADNVEANERNKTPTGSDKLPDRPFKKLKSDDEKPPEKHVEVEVPRDPERLMDTSSKKSNVDSKFRHEDKLPADVNLKATRIAGTTEVQKNGKTSVKVADDIECSILKKTRDDCAPKMTDIKKGINTNGSNRKDLVPKVGSSKGKTKLEPVLESRGTNKEPKEDQSGDGESKRKLSMTKSFKVPNPSTDRNKQSAHQEFECGPKPNVESSWFKRLPWEDRLKNAYDQGTAILLHNVDPSYTSEEVEDIIWHAFTEKCEAKVLQRTAVSSQHYAQALILLRTKEVAQKVLRKLDEDCLMLVTYGRPLVGTRCPPLSTKKNSKFFGHLVVDKARIQNNREMDEAVSTSHFSQPNTIEYDMAMEWSLLQSRSKKCWNAFHKQQEGELKKQLSDLKRK
uniref:protein ANTI-SILENCING 1 n=1 Tax=Erigeron canadensis TaxID=72917 RepID=UPI001CB9548D|nr:protein ANTI-SILENCING 1 [Erigeron canadensis]XP_043618152.1 protein ANTI-SILENCING 1 [Erigeron canadensis]